MIGAGWFFTSGLLNPGTMVASANGVFGTNAGVLYHYQNNGGWSYTGAYTVSQTVVSHDPSGFQELFVINTAGQVWANDGAGWFFTSGLLNPGTMVASANGVFGTNAGVLYHYQNNGGWSYTGAYAVSQTVVSHDPSGFQELFVINTAGQVWANDGAGWFFTSGLLNPGTMVASANGVFGTNAGVLYHYQNNGGWSYTGAYAVSQTVVSHDPSGFQELFVINTAGQVWANDGAGWFFTSGLLNPQ